MNPGSFSFFSFLFFFSFFMYQAGVQVSFHFYCILSSHCIRAMCVSCDMINEKSDFKSFQKYSGMSFAVTGSESLWLANQSCN